MIDTGTARVSRYSRRLKVQRLPIEPVSQASANQRSGRCGRVAPGVAIRLYAEDDFAARDEFTDPEILRTNLASVILQMRALGLGDMSEFPFVDPPDRRAVKDGITLLEELGALVPESDDGAAEVAPGQAAPGSLTQLGRRLARLPLDPRLGRMVLDAERNGCAREVIVIAAAMSIQDPFERPADQQEAATAMHRRFRDEHSDFITYLNLWTYLKERQKELSGSQFRKMCKAEFLHYVRIREWQDVFSQLKEVAADLGIRLSHEEPVPDRIHLSLLSGLLSQIGLRDDKTRDYRGVRNAALRNRSRIDACQEGRSLGHGWRTRGDEPAVGSDGRPDPAGVDRAQRRPPPAASLHRTAMGRGPRAGHRDAPRDAARAARYRRPNGVALSCQSGDGPGAVHPPRARTGRVADAPPLRC